MPTPRFPGRGQSVIDPILEGRPMTPPPLLSLAGGSRRRALNQEMETIPSQAAAPSSTRARMCEVVAGPAVEWHILPHLTGRGRVRRVTSPTPLRSSSIFVALFGFHTCRLGNRWRSDAVLPSSEPHQTVPGSSPSRCTNASSGFLASASGWWPC